MKLGEGVQAAANKLMPKDRLTWRRMLQPAWFGRQSKAEPPKLFDDFPAVS